MNKEEKLIFSELTKEIISLKKEVVELKEILSKKIPLEGEKPYNPDPNAPLTDKQRKYLEKNGVKISPDLTKKEASLMISEIIKKSNAQKVNKEDLPYY